MEGDFGHSTRVLVDIDVSTVPPSSLLLERDDSHSSFISVEYENLPAFCSTCSSIGHFLNVCRWNKSDKGIPVSSSKPDSARDGPATVVADEGFQVPHKHAPKLVFPQAEVPISNVFAVIQQDLGSLDSVVVHSSAGSDLILGMVSSASLVDWPCLTSLVAPTTSMVAAQGGIVSPSVERVERVVLRNGSGSSCSPVLDVDSDVRVQGPERPLSDSQSEFRPIADSSWADQVEEEELNDTTTITRRSTRIARRLASYKSGSRAFLRVSDD
ncbi:hypothetical protein LWI29_004885 [Acer saccharum]|uniref:Zinc knuckle CX2CX4HX4C domain-containing protein n=1 Tax=Acer saccharum TaxID=4024 RepID=A0AA39RFU6_ACESA|nr:hypothetical protein LWI29_004885 [Acer saccharum]